LCNGGQVWLPWRGALSSSSKMASFVSSR
jgi:hypothetical protein